MAAGGSGFGRVSAVVLAAGMACCGGVRAQEAATPAAAVPAETAVPAGQVTAAVTQGGTIHGTVVAGTPGKPGAVPLPGVAVTATNTLTGKKFTAATDIDGAYAMTIPKNGRYVVRAELIGFALQTVEVVLKGDLEAEEKTPTDFGMELASRAAAAEAKASAGTSLARGLQGLSLSGNDADTTQASAGSGNTGVTMPTLANLGDSVTGNAASAGADAITVSGQDAQMNGLANFNEDEIRQRISDAVDRAKANGMAPAGLDTDAIVGVLGNMMGGAGPGGGRGGRGGGGGGGGGRGGGSGAFRGFNPAQPHGGLNYSGEFASLDSAPWSPTLQPITNPSYVKNSFGGSFIGSPYIPGLTKPSAKQFVFLNFNGQRNTTPQILTGTVPTTAERMGDFSGLTQLINGVVQQVPIYNPYSYNPATGTETQFGQNMIPLTSISQQARNVLNSGYLPFCNVPGCEQGTTNQYNYQTVTTAGQNSANLAARYVRNFGQDAGNPFSSFRRQGANTKPTLRQNLNSNFSYSHSASDLRNIFLILGGATVSNGFNFGLGYTVGYGRFNNNANVTWNRSHAETRNYFTDTANDPSSATGITRPDDHAIAFRPNFYNGLPTLQLSEFTSISNTNPSDSIGQTISWSDGMSWRHKKHNLRWGFDIRRVHQDSLGGSNPLGTIVFSGYNTESPTDKATSAVASSGSSFADFLLGLPQQSRIQAGLNKIYLRENVFDAYAQDDFRVSDNVTLNYGVRYEYFAPYNEKDGRLVNLTGVTSGTTSVGCVTPNGVSENGQTCGVGPNDSLIHPDRTMWSPRFGVAWKPKGKRFKDTVLRAGYGINFNTSQFQTFAKLLAYQPPFALVQNNTLTVSSNAATPTGCQQQTMTQATNISLGAAFGCSSKVFQNSFAVNPNYRLGYVQVYNADIQQTLPWGVLLNIGYNGSHGSDLDVVRAPNSSFSSVTTPNAVAFTYEDSIAESTFNALTVNARKRLQHGIGMSATYQYAHSIDDASTFGGASSTSSIQNDADLHAERSNSSFDVRHKLTGNWVYELPVGPNRAFLNKGGFWAGVLDGYSLSGNFTFTSGTYFTPSYSTTTAEIAAGGDYTLRPNRVFTQPIQGSGMLRSFFNPAAFVAPAPNTYGSASRYSIKGPGQVVVDASLSRTVQLGDTRSFEGRMTASNVFNTVQYSGINTTVNSATFGQVTGAAGMRKIVFTARYRF